MFPIATQYGPVWITSYRQLHDAGWVIAGTPAPPIKSGHFLPVTGGGGNLDAIQTLSLGWLTLQRQAGNADMGSWRFPGVIADGAAAQMTNLEFRTNRLGPVVIVDDSLFGTLVNDNMEVRTLVSIDPKTGAAKDTALFTYEAIPRGALLWFEVIYTNPATYGIAGMTTAKMQEAILGGFELMKYLGLGGMNTRGLGRVEIRSTKREVAV
jgi:CRISPR-associated protein Cmr4